MANFWHNDIAITQSGKALVTFKSPVDSKVEPSRVMIDSEYTTGSIASWGSNNDFPQKLLDSVRKNGAALSGLRVLRKAHYGSGFILAQETFDQEGKRLIQQKSIKQYPVISDFWNKSQMSRFWRETITDLEYFNIAFPEFILTENYKSIYSVRRQKTANCRFEVMDKETGFIKNCYISNHWATAAQLNSNYVAKVPLIDSYWSADQVKEYCKDHKIQKFIRPQFYPLVDESYYPKSEWHSVYNNGWVDVANSIPEFKKAIFRNQINIKFLIEVAEDYFHRAYPEDWETYTPERRKEIRDEFVTMLDSTLRDNANAGKSIMSMVYKDDMGNALPGLKINPIDNLLKEGSYLPEASAANSEILFALGVDPSLIGAGIPGGKLGAGSGSDKREAFLILSALLKTNRETTLEAFDFIKEYNQWPSDLIGGFEDTVLTTLDANPTGSQKAAQL